MSFYLSGCGAFFEKKSTEIETRQILNDLEQVKESKFIDNPLPELYRSAPKIIDMPGGVKLFYFAKNHSADILANMIRPQIKGTITTANPATNQIIVHCADRVQAEKTLEFLNLTDVPPIQVNIDCIILERFADVTMDWEATLLMENFLGQEITFGAGKFPNPAFPGASLRESKRSSFGLDVGYWINEGIDGHQFRAVVDLLISRGYLKILMNPTLETVNGQKATIKSREHAPLEKIVTGNNIEPYSLTDYQWVEDSLEVTPHVYADGSIGLETEIKIGSRSKPEGVVQQSIITERFIRIAENRIKPGNSLIVGGLRKAEQRSVIRGVPFFKDIPLIGVLFSSKDYEEKATEIIFILTPSISENGSDHAEMVKNIQRKYELPKSSDPSIENMLTDPFGGLIYTEHVEKMAAEAEYQRTIAEIETAQAEEEINLLKYELVKAAQQVKEEHEKANEAKKAAQNALKKVNEATSKMMSEQERAKAALKEAKKAQQDARKAKEELEKSRELQKKLQEERAKADTEAAKAKAEQKTKPAEKPTDPNS